VTNIEKLANVCRKLLALLDDPSPEQNTWHEAVRRLRVELMELHGVTVSGGQLVIMEDQP